MLIIMFTLLCTGGCGGEKPEGGIQSEALDTLDAEENSGGVNSGAADLEKANVEEAGSGNQETADGFGESENKENQSVSIEGMIKEQSFEVELEGAEA